MTALRPYPWTEPDTQQGVDVSSAQRPNAALMLLVVAAGCVAVDIKACDYDIGRRAPFQDPACLQHVAHARAAGARTGLYAFFKSLQPWQAQAEQYLRVLDAAGPMALRPTIDWEDVDRIKIDPARALDGVLHWGDFVRQRTARPPTCYTGKNITDTLTRAGVDCSGLLAFDLWQAHYRWDPVTGHDFNLAGPTPIYLNGVLWPTVAWQCGGNGAPHVATPPDANGHVQVAPVDLDRDVYPHMPTLAIFDRWCAGPILPPAPTRPAFDLTRPRDLQAALVALGLNPGPIDGVVGPRTVVALRQFQTTHGLVADGIAGPKTRAAITAALSLP